MRYFLALFALCVAATVGLLGFRGSHFRKPPVYIFPDMEWQLKLRPQKENGFFPNGLSSQLPVPGTIARGAPIQTSARVWSMGMDVIENNPSSRPHCKAMSRALNATASTPGR